MKLHSNKTGSLIVESCGSYGTNHGSGCVAGDLDHVTLSLKCDREYFDIIFTDNAEVEGMIAVLQRIKGQLVSTVRPSFLYNSSPVKP